MRKWEMEGHDLETCTTGEHTTTFCVFLDPCKLTRSSSVLPA